MHVNEHQSKFDDVTRRHDAAAEQSALIERTLVPLIRDCDKAKLMLLNFAPGTDLDEEE